MPARINHVAITSDHYAMNARFYQALFGMTPGKRTLLRMLRVCVLWVLGVLWVVGTHTRPLTQTCTHASPHTDTH